MKAVMLAAGIGARLGDTSEVAPPKVLLRFGGKSLLQYHIEALSRYGIEELVLGVGYRHEAVEREIRSLDAADFVRTVFNESYEEGNIVTLWTLRNELRCRDSVLLMDADVLYDARILQRLLVSPHQNCLLIDRDFEEGEEPVKICVRNGEIVEFRKWLNTGYDYCGESVGFFKLSAEAADRIVLQAELYIGQERRSEAYEEAIRDVLLTAPSGTFGFEDITGLPWIEIDFTSDIVRANSEILPRVLAAKEARAGRQPPRCSPSKS